MSFLRIDTNRLKRRGSIFIVRIGRDRLVVGRSQGTSRVNALLQVAADYVDKDYLPELKVIKFKKSTDTFKSEALLHSYLAEHRARGEDWYYILTKDELDSYWREV